VNPFGGDVLIPDDMAQQITFGEYTSFMWNPGPNSAFNFDTTQIATANFGEDGSVETEIISLPLDQSFIPPSSTVALRGPQVGLTRADDQQTPDDQQYADEMRRLDEWLAKAVPLEKARRLMEGLPVVTPEGVFVPPKRDFRGIVGQFFEVRGTRFEGTLPLDGCGGNIIELFTGDAISGAPAWEAADFAPNDSFAGISQAHVVRCSNDMWQPLEFLVNEGSSFQPAPTGAFAVIYPEGMFTFIPVSEVAGSEGFRIGAFITPAVGSYQADNVGFTTAPPYPALAPPNSAPAFIENPFPGHTLHPVALEMGPADDGSPGWMGNYGIAFDAADDSGGIDMFTAHMIQFDTHQITKGLFTYDPATNTYAGELIGSGDGNSEAYSFGDGMYEYNSGSLATYPMTVMSGTDQSLLDQMALVYDERVLQAQATVTTTTQAATGADEPSEPEAQEVVETTETTDDQSSSIGLFVLLALLLAIAAFLIWWFFFKPKPDPCHEKRLAWQKAQGACDEAQKTAKETRKAADDAAENRKKADNELKDHCKAFPPACGKQASATDVGSGRTVTRDDLHVQRQWAADAWSRYRAETQSAQETEDQWKSEPSDEFRNKQLKKLEDAKAKTPGLEKAASEAIDAEKTANDAADKAEKAAKEACDKAAAAKKVYDDCIGAQQGVAPGAADAGAGGGVAGGAAAVGGAAGKKCEKERLAYEAAKKACDTASTTADQAEADADAADTALEDAEDSLDQLCAEYPPLCRDDWVQEAGQPATRITTRDLYLNDVWAEQVWLDYSYGDISAQEVSDRWSQDPPADFARDELRKIDDARPLKAPREQTVKDAKSTAEAKRSAAEKARAAADESCAKANAAQKAWETCQGGR